MWGKNDSIILHGKLTNLMTPLYGKIAATFRRFSEHHVEIYDVFQKTPPLFIF